MTKASAPPPEYYGPPPAAPPSYFQAVGGVAPSSPYTPGNVPKHGPMIMTTVVPVGPQSTHMTCAHCGAEIMTVTRSEPGLIAYISGIIIALMGCFCGCCFIPCCIGSCRNVHHTCPNCNSYVGRYTV